MVDNEGNFIPFSCLVPVQCLLSTGFLVSFALKAPAIVANSVENISHAAPAYDGILFRLDGGVPVTWCPVMFSWGKIHANWNNGVFHIAVLSFP